MEQHYKRIASSCIAILGFIRGVSQLFPGFGPTSTDQVDHFAPSVSQLETEINELPPSFTTQTIGTTCELSTKGEQLLSDWKNKFTVMTWGDRNKMFQLKNALDQRVRTTELQTAKRCILQQLRDHLEFMITNYSFFRGERGLEKLKRSIQESKQQAQEVDDEQSASEL